MSTFEKMLVVVSSTPTLSSLTGAKKTLVPTAAAPAYLEPSLTPAAVVSMVEKVWAIATSARPRIAPSSIPTKKKKRRRGEACALRQAFVQLFCTVAWSTHCRLILSVSSFTSDYYFIF